MARNCIERIWLHLQMNGPGHVLERFADAASALREQNVGAVVVQHEREIRREPPAFRKHPRREIAKRVNAPVGIALQDGADLTPVGQWRHSIADALRRCELALGLDDRGIKVRNQAVELQFVNGFQEYAHRRSRLDTECQQVTPEQDRGGRSMFNTKRA